MTRTILFDGDWTPTDRADVGLALDWDDPEYGQFSAYSDPSADAAWIHLHVRSAHYLGAGHHHSDAGLFHFSALGVDWIAESPFHSAYEGRLHNQVLVDGVSQPGMFPARARYLGAQVGPEGSVAVADLTYAYSWRWNTQPGRSSALAWDHGPWELEPAPDILALFRGTLRQKMRPWWPTYAYSNAVPTSRAPFNPMRQVFRSVALLRGPAPYALVVDDAAKDDQVRLYEWTASLVPGVRPARLAGGKERECVLAFRPRPRGPFTTADVAEVEPRDGEPLLLVHDLSGGQPEVALVPGVPDRQGAPQSYPRLSIARQGSSARFRVLLIPFRAGQPRPSIAPTESGDGCVVDGRDEIAFTLGPDGRSRLEVRRGGRIVLSTATPPAEDRLATAIQ